MSDKIPELLAAIDAVMDEYRQFAGQNDPAVGTGMARLWGAKRIADLVRRFVAAPGREGEK